MKSNYEAFLAGELDLSPVGVQRNREAEPYFCTPVNAEVFGGAGVDGIHFCRVPGFGETVFAVSPMNTAPHVRPIARSFDDFLRLLLACGDSAALEQAWMWNEAQFGAFVEECDAAPKELAVQTGLTPMEQPWRYLHSLQESFDYGAIPYSEEYYEITGTSPPVSERPWKVFFSDNFWGHAGRDHAGQEIPVEREFSWAGRQWRIPAVYRCGKGLVVDLCAQVEKDAIRSFMDKWDLSLENEHKKRSDPETRMRMEAESPLGLDFRPSLILNGRKLPSAHGCGITYNPCLPEGTVDNTVVLWVMNHYGLNPAYGWSIYRYTFPWKTGRAPKLQSLELQLKQYPARLPGPHFTVSGAGEEVRFHCPLDEEEHVLTVVDYAPQTLSLDGFGDGREYPPCGVSMEYTVAPPLPEGYLTLEDCARSDRPRQCASAGQNGTEAAAMGIIGGADGPTAILWSPGHTAATSAAVSSLHFAPPETVEWRMVFHQKQFADVTQPLI